MLCHIVLTHPCSKYLRTCPPIGEPPASSPCFLNIPKPLCKVKKEIGQLLSCLNPDTDADAEKQQPDGTVAAIMDQEKPGRAADEDGEPLMWPNDAELDVCRFVKEKLRELPACKKESTPETALACLLQRIEAMRALLRDWCVNEQLQERCLSRAQILGECSSANEWNEIQHQLALARQASHLGNGQRRSRMEVWTSRQQQMHGGKASDSAIAVPDAGPICKLSNFGAHVSCQPANPDLPAPRQHSCTRIHAQCLQRCRLDRPRAETKCIGHHWTRGLMSVFFFFFFRSGG